MGVGKLGVAGLILVLLPVASYWGCESRVPFIAGDPADSLWTAPEISSLAGSEQAELIRYGQLLVSSTAVFFGPRGTIGRQSNGMSCQNCHLKAGMQPWGNNFGAVASTYPRFRARRGSVESISQRIADCFERSLNGRPPDSDSREMRAYVAYIRWLGEGVSRGKKPRGTGLEDLPFPNRAADTAKGRMAYVQKCQVCHRANGEGVWNSDSISYNYPPLWGDHSYNTAAGLYRLSRFAAFIRDNMPFGSSYRNRQLTNEEAWDLAAFVNSQPRPVKVFVLDWPYPALKPSDQPFGPYTDSFSEKQHKYGPFGPIEKARKER